MNDGLLTGPPARCETNPFQSGERFSSQVLCTERYDDTNWPRACSKHSLYRMADQWLALPAPELLWHASPGAQPFPGGDDHGGKGGQGSHPPRAYCLAGALAIHYAAAHILGKPQDER